MNVDIKEIRTLIDLMKKNGLAVFKMEKEGFKITLKTAEADGATHHGVTPAPKLQLSAPPTPSVAISQNTATSSESFIEIKSPMVGTFYAASSPDAAPFIAVGQEVRPDMVVCIIEAMKVMNEIQAEVSGIVAEVCAENGKPVQFGQTLFRLK